MASVRCTMRATIPTRWCRSRSCSIGASGDIIRSAARDWGLSREIERFLRFSHERCTRSTARAAASNRPPDQVRAALWSDAERFGCARHHAAQDSRRSVVLLSRDSTPIESPRCRACRSSACRALCSGTGNCLQPRTDADSSPVYAAQCFPRFRCRLPAQPRVYRRRRRAGSPRNCCPTCCRVDRAVALVVPVAVYMYRSPCKTCRGEFAGVGGGVAVVVVVDGHAAAKLRAVPRHQNQT